MTIDDDDDFTTAAPRSPYQNFRCRPSHCSSPNPWSCRGRSSTCWSRRSSWCYQPPRRVYQICKCSEHLKSCPWRLSFLTCMWGRCLASPWRVSQIRTSPWSRGHSSAAHPWPHPPREGERRRCREWHRLCSTRYGCARRWGARSQWKAEKRAPAAKQF